MNSKPQSITAALLLASGLILTVCPTVPAADDAVDRWPEEKARAWQQRTGWLVGCNFLPSTAINQLEMFQADTFDRWDQSCCRATTVPWLIVTFG